MAGNRMVGMTGFEPATSCSQSRRATKLRHIPTLHSGIDYSRRIEICRKDFASDQPLPFPAAPALRASSPNEICTSLTTFNPIHQGHHNHSHIRTTFFTSNITWRVILSTLLVIALSNSIGMRLRTLFENLILAGEREADTMRYPRKLLEGLRRTVAVCAVAALTFVVSVITPPQPLLMR